MDEISYKLLYNLPERAIEILTNIYNRAISDGHIPQEWKLISLIPIPKQHTDNKQIHFRPIAISCIRKVLEIIIADKIQHYLLHNNLWPEHQKGFKEGSGTIHSLVTLITDIQIAMIKNEKIEAIFLDIQKAYDNVDITILIQNLKEYKLPDKLLFFLYKLLTDRRVTISHTEVKEYRSADIGLVQGSPLSPILFTLYTAKIAKIQERGIRTLQYADDIVIYRRISKEEEDKTKFQRTINSTIAWLKTHNLEVNLKKSHYIIFNNRRGKNQLFSIEIIGTKIMMETHTKFLGVILDEHLKWDKHCNHILKKVVRAQRIITYLAGRWWGASLATLVNLYKGLIQPIIDYGSITINYLQKDKQKIQSIIYQILKNITGINGNPAYQALAVELQIMPHEFRARKLATNFLVKIYTNLNNRITPKLQYVCETLFNIKKWGSVSVIAINMNVVCY